MKYKAEQGAGQCCWRPFLFLFHKFPTFFEELLGAGGLKVCLMGLTPFRIRELLFETLNVTAKLGGERVAVASADKELERAKLLSTQIV